MWLSYCCRLLYSVLLLSVRSICFHISYCGWCRKNRRMALNTKSENVVFTYWNMSSKKRFIRICDEIFTNMIFVLKWYTVFCSFLGNLRLFTCLNFIIGINKLFCFSFRNWTLYLFYLALILERWWMYSFQYIMIFTRFSVQMKHVTLANFLSR